MENKTINCNEQKEQHQYTKFKYFKVTDNNPRLLNILKTYISNKFIINYWDETGEIQDDYTNNIYNMSTNVFDELNNSSFLEITSFDSNINSRRYKFIEYTNKSKKSLKVYYTFANGQEYHFKYKDYDFICVIKTEGNKALELSNGSIKYYQVLVIKTNSTKEILDNFIQDAVEYNEKYYSPDEDADNTIKLQLYSDGFWETIGFREERDLSTIYLPKQNLDSVIEDFTNFCSPEKKKEYKLLGIPYKRNYLFEGTPGTGKTSLIVALASQCKKDIALLSFNDKFTDIDLMRAIKTVPNDCILVMEDIDALFQERKKNDDQRVKISFSGLLNSLDGLCFKSGQIVIMTTNHKLYLDPALIRAGRIDYVMNFTNITKEQVKSMYLKFMYITDTDDKQFDEFWNSYVNIDVNITTSILQQYLIQHIKNPQNALINIDDIKKIYTDSQTSSQDKTQLYI